MKRKADNTEAATSNGRHKKLAIDNKTISNDFRKDLFAAETRDGFTKEYAASNPYRHGVVSNLINDKLLRSVRSEILENIVFTPKETDIYKIHQSGDLANLEGLPDAELSKLPSLQQLRNALYSSKFRQWLSTVTGAGALSGTKTDMAVNVYVPGCHLLCHDDVIGTRRVSYILYLTNPDIPWKAEWGGALRLYPTTEVSGDSGKIVNIPSAEWSKTIPPAWNQLSFFAIQPGLSFHDVEEVYQRPNGNTEEDGGRFRMAISGWFHIPEEHEEGYEPGLEQKLAERSSLHQLEGKADAFDTPQLSWHDPETSRAKQNRHGDDEIAEELSEADLEFLIQFITPQYLTPDTVEELNEDFTETSMLQLNQFLNAKFAARLKAWIEDEANSESTISRFSTSTPPHKHRYQYLLSQPTPAGLASSQDYRKPFDLVLNDLLPSLAFKKWLSLLTGLTLQRSAILARRFRRGLDYELAQRYSGEDPQLEYCLSITPTTGWGANEEDESQPQASKTQPQHNEEEEEEEEETNPGGYEVYLAGDDDDSDSEDGGSDHGVSIPTKLQSHTGAGDRKSSSRAKADPAIYKSAAEDEDDGTIASNPPSWNVLRIVLRDKGTMRFVKYVSQAAPGDRWDFVGAVEVEEDDDDGEEDDS